MNVTKPLLLTILLTIALSSNLLITGQYEVDAAFAQVATPSLGTPGEPPGPCVYLTTLTFINSQCSSTMSYTIKVELLQDLYSSPGFGSPACSPWYVEIDDMNTPPTQYGRTQLTSQLGLNMCDGCPGWNGGGWAYCITGQTTPIPLPLLPPGSQYAITFYGGSNGVVAGFPSYFTVYTTPQFDFSMPSLPGVITQPASTISQSISVGILSAATAVVGLSATGCGLAYAFSPTSGSPPFVSQMTTQVTNPTSSNCQVTVTGTAGPLIHSSIFTLTVTNIFDFSLPSLTAASVTQGSYASKNINVASVYPGVSGSVSLSAQSSCASNLSFNPISGSPGFSTVLTYQATGSIGSSCQVTITGTGSSTNYMPNPVHSQSFALTISTPSLTLTVASAQGKLGNPNYYGTNTFQQAQIVQLAVTSPANVTTETRWVIQGYSVDGGSTVSGSSVSVTMNQPHAVSWIWQKQVQVTVQSNIPNWSGYFSILGGGWQASGSAVVLQAPQAITIGSTQWVLQQWRLVSGKGSFSSDSTRGQVAVVLQSDPIFEADYTQGQGAVSQTTTVQSTITIQPPQPTFTVSFSSTGGNPATLSIEFEVVDSNAPNRAVGGANVTVTDTSSGKVIWPGKTDPYGFAPAQPTNGITLLQGQRYSINIQVANRVYSEDLTADVGGLKLIDIAKTPSFQPSSLDSQLGLGTVFLVLVVVTAVGVYRETIRKTLSRRKKRRGFSLSI